MKKTTVENIENRINQLLEITEGSNPIRDKKNRFISLHYLLTGNLEKTDLEFLAQAEYDLIKYFRTFTPEIKSAYIKMFKDVSTSLKSSNPKSNPSYTLSIDELKEGLHLWNETPYKCYCRAAIGYCYIGIDENWSGYYKIGKTMDATCRTRVYSSVNPNYKIIYRTKDFYKNATGLEAKIHNSLNSNRIQKNGCTEWFKLSNEELNNIINKYNFVKLEEL